jgi:hypothetical protein
VTFLICSLAVYKVIQVVDALMPKEAMPWVKVLFGVALGYGVAIPIGLYNPWISGLAVATAAGTLHSVLRMLTYVGDAAHRRSLK